MEDPSSLLVDSDPHFQIPYSPLISEEPPISEEPVMSVRLHCRALGEGEYALTQLTVSRWRSNRLGGGRGPPLWQV